MKTRTTLSVLVTCLFISTASFSQSPAAVILGKNIIKWNLSALAIEQYGIQYEHVISPVHSYCIGFGVSPNVELPFKSQLLDQFGDNADAKKAIESTKFTKYTVTPEYRFYLGKAAPKGFYVATFIRYTNMTIDQVYPYTPSNGIPHTAQMNGKISGVGAGAMIGTQWLIGPSVTLDLWMVGPFIGAMDASFHGTGDMSDMNAADVAKLESDIESVKIPLWTIDATVGSNVVDVKMKGPFYGVRLLGFCFGFRF